MTSRSEGGSSSSARWTRQATHADSACSLGVSSPEASSGRSAAVSSRAEQLVRALESLALVRREVADEVVEVGAAQRTSSPSRMSARRPRALRVRVFTVPSGTFRNSATSLCESPLQ